MNSSKLTFFRQGGWMAVATTVSGVFMWAVHAVASQMEPTEYAVFGALLKVFLLMSFPAIGLQIVFSQQTAAAISDGEKRQLAAAARALLRGTFLIWVVIAAAAVLLRGPILTALKITNPAALWVTVLLGLSSLWVPILRGLLQGSQRFASFGWVTILDGVGRFIAVIVIVSLGGQAAGAITGALFGQIVALSTAFWLTRHLWIGPVDGFDWKTWTRRSIPLTLTFGSVLAMTCADVVFVQTVFPKGQTEYYIAGGAIGLALVSLVTPFALVMFPKIVESARLQQRTDVLSLALGVTVLITSLAALACTLFPELPMRILFFRKPDFWKSAAIVPWFAWALLPLILTNVLVSNLMAREKFGVAPWLGGLALAYGVALILLRGRFLQMEMFAGFKAVIGTLGAFSALMFLVTLWFTRKEMNLQRRRADADSLP